jgi:hypothetical protein
VTKRVPDVIAKVSGAWRRRGRLLLRAVVVVLLSGVVLVSAAPEASAAACWDTGCDGLSPDITGCSYDAYTVASAPIPNPLYGGSLGTVEVRFSSACQAQWTRMVLPQHACDSMGYCPERVDIHRWAQGGYPDLSPGPSVLAIPNSWSLMVGAQYAQATSTGCVVVSGLGYIICASVTA